MMKMNREMQVRHLMSKLVKGWRLSTKKQAQLSRQTSEV